MVKTCRMRVDEEKVCLSCPTVLSSELYRAPMKLIFRVLGLERRKGVGLVERRPKD